MAHSGHSTASAAVTAPRDAELRRNLRSMLGDGAAFSVMVGLGETYVAAFALAVGHDAVVAGLLTSVPLLAGAMLQLITPLAVRSLASHRRWVLLCAATQALSFVPLAAGAWWGHLSIAWLFAAVAVYWGAGMAAGAAWNTWVGTLVPYPMRSRFFARRARWGQVAVVCGIVAAGVILETGERNDVVLPAFATLFVGSLLARAISVGFLSRQSEPVPLPRQATPTPEEVLATSPPRSGRHLLGYLVAMQLAVYTSTPYFTPFMLDHLAMSYGAFVGLTALAFGVRALSLPLLGRFAERHGARSVLVLGGTGVIPLAPLWLLSDNLAWLALLQVAAGFFWAAYELAALLMFFDVLDERRRTRLLTLYNLANSVAMVAGSLLGGALLAWFEASGTGYAAVFLCSAAGRLGASSLLARQSDTVPRRGDPPMRTLAVRPGTGGLLRPITAVGQPRPDEPPPPVPD